MRTASAPLAVMLAKAAASGAACRTATGSIARPMLRATRSISARYGLVTGSVSLASTAKRRAAGITSRISSTGLPATSTAPTVVPVTLPPGRARDKAGANRFAHAGHPDGNIAGRLFGGGGGRRLICDDIIVCTSDGSLLLAVGDT